MLMGMSSRTVAEDRLLAESWAGEVRINLLRALALSALYIWHLVRFYFLHDESITRRYHLAVTALMIFGFVLVVTWHLILSANVWSQLLPRLTTLGDLILATALFGLSRGALGTQAPAVFFLVVAATAVRGSIALVWLATLGSVIGYFLAVSYWQMYPAEANPIPLQSVATAPGLECIEARAGCRGVLRVEKIPLIFRQQEPRGNRNVCLIEAAHYKCTLRRHVQNGEADACP